MTDNILGHALVLVRHLVCRRCGKEFIEPRRRARPSGYCSPQCRREGVRKSRGLSVDRCPTCGHYVRRPA